MKPLSVFMKDAWDALRRFDGDLDSVEVAVRKQLQRPTPEGRETFFHATQSYVFGVNDFVSQSHPLLTSAGAATRVVRMTYSADLRWSDGTRVRTSPFRTNPRGLIAETAVVAANETPAAVLFDFEWDYHVGTTQKNYAQSRGMNNKPFLSRSALGNPENSVCLLFSERNPLVLRTNETLTIEINPTFLFMDVQDNDILTASPPEIVVNFSYAAHRTAGYDS